MMMMIVDSTVAAAAAAMLGDGATFWFAAVEDPHSNRLMM
jgi:hypothetical protein